MTDSSAENREHAFVDSDEPDAPAELVESEARLRAMLAATGAAIVCTDDQLRITEFNPAAERVFGRRRAEVIGRRYSELLPAVVRRKVERDFERVLSGRAIRLFENVLEDPAGHTTIVLWDVQRIVDGHGRATGVVAVGQNITARQNPSETRKRR